MFKVFRGKLRLFFGFCPECNSDAPKCYSCRICKNQRHFPDKKTKKLWWSKFVWYNDHSTENESPELLEK